MVPIPAMRLGLALEQTLVRSDGEAALARSHAHHSGCVGESRGVLPLQAQPE